MILIAPLVLLIYGVGAWRFSRQVLPQWNLYTAMADRGALGEAAQYIVGAGCAAIWPLAWVVLRPFTREPTRS